MKNTFWWGKDVNPFLFKGFSVNSYGGLFGICLLVFTMSFAFEFLRYMQIKHKHRELVLRVKQLKLLCPTESATLLASSIKDRSNPLDITILYRSFLCGSEVSLWLLLQIIGYFLMLSVMIYNVWFLISAVLGGGLGYLIFGSLFVRLNVQNCQIMRSAFCTQICGETDVREGQSTPAVLQTPTTSHQNLESQDAPQATTEVTVHVRCH